MTWTMCRTDVRRAVLLGVVNLAIFTAAVWSGWMVADTLVRARDRYVPPVD